MLAIDLKYRIIEALKPINPEKIILFGSYAYGNPDNESDIDLLVIKNIKKDKVRDCRIEIKKRLWQKFKDQYISFDVLVDSEERIYERIKIGDSFYEEIYTKGEVIYA